MKNERLVHRLEAFSDIVMGFVLAEMAVTLVIPKTVPSMGDLLANLAAFPLPFGLVAILWTLHTRLFATYFVLNALMMVLNFAMLASLVMMSYVFSLAMHFAGMPGAAPIMGMWFYCFAATYVLLASMYGIGTYLRRAELTPREFSSGVERVVGAVVGSGALVLVGTLFPHFNHVRQANHALLYVAGLAIAAFALRLVIRRRLLSSKT